MSLDGNSVIGFVAVSTVPAVSSFPRPPDHHLGGIRMRLWGKPQGLEPWSRYLYLLDMI